VDLAVGRAVIPKAPGGQGHTWQTSTTKASSLAMVWNQESFQGRNLGPTERHGLGQPASQVKGSQAVVPTRDFMSTIGHCPLVPQVGWRVFFQCCSLCPSFSGVSWRKCVS
jgi:hypothetical protein